MGLYLDCKVGVEVGPTLYSWWFPWVLWQYEALHCLEGWKSNILLFSLGSDLILYFSQHNVGMIFSIDGLVFLKENKHVSTVEVMMFVVDDMRRVLHSLSLSRFLSLSLSVPSLKVLHHSNTRVLEKNASPNCFLSLWRISNGRTPSVVRNLIIMRCYTLIDTFYSLVSLVELRQDWTSSQLPEREGKEATSPFQGLNVLDGVLLS